MKLADVKPGNTYWHNTSTNWDSYPDTWTNGYDRFAARRLDGERYNLSGTTYTSAHKRNAYTDDKGQYVKVEVLDFDGNPVREGETTVKYVQARALREEIGDYRDRVRADKARRAAAEAARAEATERATERATELQARLDRLGLADLFKVTHTDGRSYGSSGARTNADLVDDYNSPSADTLTALLDRFETLAATAGLIESGE